jgi:hypothetical protein
LGVVRYPSIVPSAMGHCSWAKARVTELPAHARWAPSGSCQNSDRKGDRRGERTGGRQRCAAITEQGLATDRPTAEGGRRRVASSRHNALHSERSLGILAGEKKEEKKGQHRGASGGAPARRCCLDPGQSNATVARETRQV